MHEQGRSISSKSSTTPSPARSARPSLNACAPRVACSPVPWAVACSRNSSTARICVSVAGRLAGCRPAAADRGVQWPADLSTPLSTGIDRPADVADPGQQRPTATPVCRGLPRHAAAAAGRSGPHLPAPGAINLQWYAAGEGGYPYWHCELYPKDAQAETLHRHVLWTLYLNDDFDEGETEFLFQGRKIAPRTGSLLIAPTAFTHTHRGNRPQGGTSSSRRVGSCSRVRRSCLGMNVEHARRYRLLDFVPLSVEQPLPWATAIENRARRYTEHCHTEANELFFSKPATRHQLAGRQQQDVQWKHPQERDAKPVDNLHFIYFPPQSQGDAGPPPFSLMPLAISCASDSLAVPFRTLRIPLLRLVIVLKLLT